MRTGACVPSDTPTECFPSIYPQQARHTPSSTHPAHTARCELLCVPFMCFSLTIPSPTHPPFHAQLSQVIGELRSTAYRPKMSVLASRQQMCVHRDISKLAGTAQNMACKAAVAARSCRHFIAVDAYLQSHGGLSSEPLDIEDLVYLGRSSGPAHHGGTCGPCPYFLSRTMANVRPSTSPLLTSHIANTHPDTCVYRAPTLFSCHTTTSSTRERGRV